MTHNVSNNRLEQHMKILVTGSTGRIGSRVADQLSGTHEVVRASRSPRGANAVRFDWTDRETWSEAVSGVDAVFLLTPEAAGNLGEDVASFVAVARKANVKRIVLLSAIGVGLGPDVTGMEFIEQAVSSSGVSYSILRANTFMQNFVSGPFAGPIAESGAVVAPVGDVTVSFVDLRDLAACAVYVLQNDVLGTFELTGAESLTFADAATQISRSTGKQIGFVDPGVEATRMGMLAGGMPPPVVEMILGFYATLRSGAHSHVTTILEEFLSRPAIDFATFADDHREGWHH
jgi:uncharacterized protein YbjT (DUF2867 family)